MKNEIVIENTKNESVAIVDENDKVIEHKSRREMVGNIFITRELIIFVIGTLQLLLKENCILF